MSKAHNWVVPTLDICHLNIDLSPHSNGFMQGNMVTCLSLHHTKPLLKNNMTLQK